MAGINKRVEHHLKDLINEKGNSNRCGECGADYPTWASVNLGVFLCGRCASVHRKLGPEISEVKSLTLDKWYESDLDFLSSIGNKRALQIWNPQKVPFPFDDDDKDEIYQYLRKKYVLGKFRYDPPTEEDYNLDAASQPSTRFRESSSRDRNSSRPASSRASSSRSYYSSFKPSSTGGSGNSITVPALSHKDVPEIERLKYRNVEPHLQDRGFRNKDDNFEALFLARGDIKLAVRILENSPEHKPALPRRPVTASSTSQTQTQTKAAPASTSDWWNGNGASSAAASEQTTQSATTFPIDPQTGLLEPPQQYLDPNTGIIYVDPVHQQQYLQQQEYVQQLQQQQQQQQQQIQSQPTGMNKNQLMSLYSTGSTQQINQQFQQPQIQQQVPAFQNTTTGQFQQPQFTQQFQQQQPQLQQPQFTGFQPQPQQPQFTGFQPQPQQQTYQQQFNPQQGFNGF